MINNADYYSQPSLIIFTKGADIFGHDYIYIHIGDIRYHHCNSAFNNIYVDKLLSYIHTVIYFLCIQLCI